MFLRLMIFSAIAHVSVAQQALPQTDGVSACNATSAARGETAAVTCLFPLDVISARPVAVSVEVYRNKEIETVLECRWLENDNDIICDKKEGYSMQGVAGRQLNLVITALSEHHAGLYACKMMTPRFYVSGFRPCRLEELQVAAGNTGKSSGTVEKPKKSETDSPGPKVDDDWLIETDGEDNNDKAPVPVTEKAETKMIGIILGVILTVLFVVAVVLFLIFCHVKRQRRGRRGSVAQGSCTSCLAQHGKNEEGMYSGQPPEYQKEKERSKAQERLLASKNDELSQRKEPAEANPTGYKDDTVETENENLEASSAEHPGDISAESDRRKSFRDEIEIRSAVVGLHNKKTLDKYKTLNPKATRNL